MLFKLSPTDLIISSWIFSILLCLFLRVNVSFVCLGCFAEDSALLFSSTPSIKLSCSVVRRGESEKAPEESDGYFFQNGILMHRRFVEADRIIVDRITEMKF